MATATQKIVILADDKTGAAIASAVRNSQKLDNQIRKTGDSMRGMTRQGRAQMGQLGHQMQDVAVQLQMGMNPLMILGQQGSQIAAIFGSGGAVFGAFIAIAAVIGSVFVPTLFEASRAAGEFHDDIIKAAGGVDKLTDAQRKLAQLDLQLRIQEQQTAVENAQKALDDFAKKMENLGKASEKGGRSARGAALATERLSGSSTELNQTLALAQAQLSATKEQMDALTGKTKESEAAVKALNAAFEKEVEMEQKRIDMLLEARSPQEKFLDGLAKIKQILGDPKSAQEVEAYRIQVEKLAEKYFQTAKATQEVEKETKEFGLTMNDVKNQGINAVEDGLVGLINGTKSVKDAFKDMAKSVISSLIRMQIQQSITNPLAGALGIKRGAAIGGPVEGGRPYVVGERGPELFVPTGSGRVIPNNKMGGGSNNVVVNVNMQSGETSTDDASKLGTLIGNVVKAELVRQKRPGGLLMAGA